MEGIMKKDPMDGVDRCAHCNHFPVKNLNGRCYCWTTECPHFEIKFKTVEQWNSVNRKVLQSAVRICREFGMFEGRLPAEAAPEPKRSAKRKLFARPIERFTSLFFRSRERAA